MINKGFIHAGVLRCIDGSMWHLCIWCEYLECPGEHVKVQ